MQTNVMVQQPQRENPSARKLNMVSAILSSLLLIMVVTGLIVGPVYRDPTRQYKYKLLFGHEFHLHTFITVLGVLLAIPFLIGVILSLTAAFTNARRKRNLLTAAIIAYSISVGTTFAWAAMALKFGTWMHVFLVVGFGCIALVITTSLSCSMYEHRRGVIIAAAVNTVTVVGATLSQPALSAPRLPGQSARPPKYPGYPHAKAGYTHHGYSQPRPDDPPQQPGSATLGPPSYAQGAATSATQGPSGYAQRTPSYAQGPPGYVQDPPAYTQTQPHIAGSPGKAHPHMAGQTQ